MGCGENVVSNMPEFFVDPDQKGVVRGGWFDALGGILVGVHAQEVCDILNAHFQDNGPIDENLRQQDIVGAIERGFAQIVDQIAMWRTNQ